MDSAQPRRLNNTTEGVENPTQSWDNNAAVYTISREWLDPTEFLLSSLFILFLLFWVILIDFELDCPILRAFIERERRAGGRPFQCRVQHSRLCDVHLLHHLRSRYIEEGSANEYIPFFLSCAFFYSLSLFFFIVLLQLLFLFFSRWPELAVNRWLLDIIVYGSTTPWSVWRAYIFNCWI